MDPVTLITGALAAGATVMAQQAVGEAAKDAYRNLRERVSRKLAGKPDAELILAKHEQKPEVWEEPLKDALIEVGADQDTDIIDAAEQLISHINPQQAAKFGVIIGENYGNVVSGEIKEQVTQVAMNTGHKPRKQ